jgi:hypothetical protein
VYGNRSLQSTMFKEELQDLKDRYVAQLLHHVLSDEHTDAAIDMGLLDQTKVAEFLRTGAGRFHRPRLRLPPVPDERRGRGGCCKPARRKTASTSSASA